MDDALGTPPVRRATLLDVARRVGVSVATVSNALTGRRPVDPVTRQRVERAALDLGYAPNIRARSLRTGRADTIAIVSGMPFAVAGGAARHGYLMEIAGAAAERALQNGLALMLIPPVGEGGPPLSSFHADGVIVVQPQESDPDVAALMARGTPMVSIGRPGPQHVLPFVDFHDYAATRLLLDHLAMPDDRPIGVITGAQPRDVHVQTARAFLDWAGERGQAGILSRVDERAGEEGGRMAAANLMQQHPHLGGLFVSVDTFAVGAARELSRAAPDSGYRIRLATRFDGVLARSFGLTALDLRLPEIGALAAQCLVDRLAGRPVAGALAGPMPRIVARGSSVAGLATSD